MKKFAIFLLLSLVGWVSQAAYLYFQVDAADASEISFMGARVIADDGNGGLTELFLADELGNNSEWTITGKGFEDNAINLNQLTDPSSYSFFIELVTWNEAGTEINTVAVGESKTWSELVASRYIDTGDMGLPHTPATVWHGTTYSVPEPTSAMLVMFGMGLLALKRKKA